MKLKERFFTFYRIKTPNFRGKIRLGKMLMLMLGFSIDLDTPIKARNNVSYYLPSLNDQIAIELFFLGVYEKEIIDFLAGQIIDGDVFMDVGANIGSIAIPTVSVKKIKYHCFEASPTVYSYLKSNFSLNNLSSENLINGAVSNKSGSLINFFDVSNERFGEGHISMQSDKNTIQIESICLDDYCFQNNIDEIDWLKVDVQGFEGLVFEGLNNMLSVGKVKNILFEFEEWAEKEAKFEIGYAKNIILKYGYQLKNIDGEKWTANHEKKNTMIWATL